jgi:hypothetical protein
MELLFLRMRMNGRNQKEKKRGAMLLQVRQIHIQL